MKFLKRLFFVVLISGCGFKAIDVEVQANFTIIDMDNKPVVNKKINLYFQNHSSYFDIKTANLRQTKTTDANGKVNFDYVWQNDESTNNYFIIACEDNPLFDNSPFKGINYIVSSFTSATRSTKTTISETIRVDSLKSLTVWLKSNRKDLYRYSFEARANKTENIVTRNFKIIDVNRTASNLDTTFVVKGYSKQDYKLFTNVWFSTSPTSASNVINIDAQTKRDSVVLIEL